MIKKNSYVYNVFLLFDVSYHITFLKITFICSALFLSILHIVELFFKSAFKK